MNIQSINQISKNFSLQKVSSSNRLISKDLEIKTEENTDVFQSNIALLSYIEPGTQVAY